MADRSSLSSLLALILVLVLALGQLPAQVAPAEAAPAVLPAAPAGWPSTLQLGLADGPGGAAAMRATAPYGFRYQYLSGGVRTSSNWSTWNPNGEFVTYYVQESAQQGIVPVFTYYMIYQSHPGNSQSESNSIRTNLQDAATMREYFSNLKLFFQRAGAFPTTMIVLHVEPDMWGYLQQRSSGDNAATVSVKVAASGLPELAGLPDNLVGFARALDVLRDAHAPNVKLGYHVSSWGTGNDIVYSDPPDATVDSLATRSGNFFTSLQGAFDVTFGEFSDRDSGFKQHVYGDGGASWWTAGDFARNVRFLTRFVQVTQKRVVLWQIPFGNTRMRAMNNTWNHYQDNRVEWLLDEPSRTHLSEYVNAGVIAFLFGRGADGATCACDANRDGVTNPSPINGNTRASLNADDDGGFFREKARAYYAGGPMPLTGGPLPATPTTTVPTATATPTRTPTPTATPAQSGQTTLTFDDRAGQNQALNGQYPSGVIDWGTGQWWHSGPYGSFTTKSVSFTSGATSRTLRFMTPRRLARLDAYNGGGGPTTVTLGCPGQPTRTATLAAGQTATVTTGWTGACGTVTVTSSNGWDTNFDNLVLDGG
jgi:hypothetical protein